jgi:hypothetical protein
MPAPEPDIEIIKVAEANYAAHCAAKTRHAEIIAASERADLEAERAKVLALAAAGASGDAAAIADARSKRAAAAEELAVAREVGAAMESRATELRRAIETAKADAHRPLMAYAAAEAIAAAQDAAAAIKAHGEAISRYDRAAECANRARGAGLEAPYGGGDAIALQHHYPSTPIRPEMARILRSPAEEVALWGEYAPKGDTP